MIQLPAKSDMVWKKFFDENRVMVYRYTIKEVKKAINDDVPSVDLFKFANGHTTTIQFKYFGKVLEDCLRLFVKEEDYEYAEKTKKLLDAYHIQKLLKEVSNGA